jgi:hypothetical protein
MSAERYLLLLLRAVYRASRGQGDALLKRLAQQLAEADTLRRERSPGGLRSGGATDGEQRERSCCCAQPLPGHRTPLPRGADGRPEYEDYTY